MPQIFPPEIIQDTTESLFVKRTVRSKVIYLVVVATVAIAIAALPFIYVSVTTQARGVIRASDENSQLQPTIYGEVTEIRIAENTAVKRGDTLLVINSENIRAQIEKAAIKIHEDSLFIEDIKLLLSENIQNIQTPKYLTEKNYYNATLNEQNTSTDYLRKEHETNQTLFNKGVISKSEYLQSKNSYEAAASRKKNQQEQFFNRWQSEQTAYRQEIIELTTTLRQLEDEKTKYVLKAPISGTVIQFAGIQAGSFLTPGQTIAYISNDSALLAECYISPADIGYIYENQKVTFQLDAFNYNQWGLANGSVTEISKDIIVMNEKPVFRLRCSLDTKYLQLKNGYKGNLKKGMTLTGRFYLTDRTLWQLLFDKVDKWMNPKQLEIEN
ncbi:MAG: HlyD family secretion protein [Dysgonamonadaceae bacterium]|jgi:HlyD family secretion protein|nr:HlyD family secretion protein [Dysgonamonadaceae bacterium]